MPFEISVPKGGAPATSRLHRINPMIAKEADATLNRYSAAGLIQRSISLYLSPLVVIPNKSGGVWITMNYKNSTRSAASASCLPSTGIRFSSPWERTGVFPISLFFLFLRIPAHKDIVAPTAFCTPAGLYECLMPQGSSASLGWFVKVINEVIKGFE